MYRKYLKRLFDFLLSLIAFIILIPIMLLISIIVCVKLGRPIIFQQKRTGKSERLFPLYKFRTMTDEKDKDGNLLPDDERITKFGKFLRSTSLDELPELINIIKGDMSIVGPRPLLIEYLPLYNKEQKKRHNVRPGLTGLAQVNGRNNLDWEERFKEDVYYVENLSLIMDIKIILKTIIKVIKREDISEEETATARKFTGSDK